MDCHGSDMKSAGLILIPAEAQMGKVQGRAPPVNMAVWESDADLFLREIQVLTQLFDFMQLQNCKGLVKFEIADSSVTDRELELE